VSLFKEAAGIVEQTRQRRKRYAFPTQLGLSFELFLFAMALPYAGFDLKPSTSRKPNSG